MVFFFSGSLDWHRGILQRLRHFVEQKGEDLMTALMEEKCIPGKISLKNNFFP